MMAKKKIKKPRFPKAKKPCLIKEDGSENLCSKPTELRAKISAPVTLRQKMRSMWKEFKEQEDLAKQEETFADSQDFDVDNDAFPKSAYEVEGDLLDQYDQDLHSALEANEAEPSKANGESVEIKPDEEKNDEKVDN